MDELVVYRQTVELAPLEDVAKFMLIAPEKAKAQAAEIRAMRNLGMAQEVLAQKEEEQRMLNELILDAGARIGELTREIPKATGNQHTKENALCSNGATKQKTKEQIGAELGFTRHDMSRFEKLSSNKDLIEEEKALAREEHRQPTRTNVLDRARERERQLEKGVDTKRQGCRTEVGEKIIAGRNLSKRIDEIDKTMSNASQIPTYTDEDAVEEFEVIMNEFMSKLRRVIQVRNDVIKGNPKIKSLINGFSKQLKDLRGEI